MVGWSLGSTGTSLAGRAFLSLAITRGLLTAGAPGGVCALAAGVVLVVQPTGL